MIEYVLSNKEETILSVQLGDGEQSYDLGIDQYVKISYISSVQISFHYSVTIKC